MTDSLAVRPEALESSTSALGSSARLIAADLEALRSASTGLLSRWAGDASNAFALRHRGWETDFGRLEEALSRAIRALDEAHQRYLDVERANASRWSL